VRSWAGPHRPFYDLRERGMLGDSGASLLGALRASGCHDAGSRHRLRARCARQLALYGRFAQFRAHRARAAAAALDSVGRPANPQTTIARATPSSSSQRRRLIARKASRSLDRTCSWRAGSPSRCRSSTRTSTSTPHMSPYQHASFVTEDAPRRTSTSPLRALHRRRHDAGLDVTAGASTTR